MSKNKKYINISQEIKTCLKNKERFGYSKYVAKKSGVMSKYIFSYNTAKTYNYIGQKFATYIKNNSGKGLNITMEEAYKYVVPFIFRKDNSPYTMKQERAALAKIYGVDGQDICALPTRKRADIRRGRERTILSNKTGKKIKNPKSKAGHFSEKNNKEIVEFVKSVGTRSFELKKARGTDLYEINGKYYFKIRGKGGKTRYSEIVGDIQNVLNLCKNAGENLIFDKVPSNMDVHYYRAIYATTVYLNYARDINKISNKREKYFCRNDLKGVVYDREAMKIASKALGHSRVNVIASHYLKCIGNVKTY